MGIIRLEYLLTQSNVHGVKKWNGIIRDVGLFQKSQVSTVYHLSFKTKTRTVEQEVVDSLLNNQRQIGVQFDMTVSEQLGAYSIR